MKKLIFLITFYLAVGLSPNSVSAQVDKIRDKAAANEIIALQERVLKLSSQNDSIPVLLNGQVTVVPIDSITYYIERLDSTLAKIGDIGDVLENSTDIINYTLLIKDGVAQVIKEAPKPNTKEGISWWIKTIQDLWFAFAGLLTWIFTAIFRVIRKDPAVVQTFFGRIANIIKTRYFVPITGAALTIIGFVFFQTNIGALPSIIFAIVLAFGIDNIKMLLTGFFDKGDQKKTQTETA